MQKREDVKYLSPERQRWVSAAMRSAAFLVSSVANKRLEKDSEFGNHNFHVGIVATARYLIRMAELLPDVTDLHQISLDIDHLLLKLPNCKLPACPPSSHQTSLGPSLMVSAAPSHAPARGTFCHTRR